MKKILVVALVAIFGISAYAQDGLKGTWWASCQVGYQQSKTGDAKATNMMILPLAGYFVGPSTTVGAAVGTINIKNEDAVGTNAETNLLVVEPLVRKYWNVSGGLYFFGQLAAPILTGKEKESELKVNQFGLAMSGGFDYVVNKWFTVEFSYNLINFSSTTLDPKTGDKTTITDFSVAHVASADSAYVDALRGSGSGLVTPLSFGFKFLF